MSLASCYSLQTARFSSPARYSPRRFLLGVYGFRSRARASTTQPTPTSGHGPSLVTQARAFWISSPLAVFLAAASLAQSPFGSAGRRVHPPAIVRRAVRLERRRFGCLLGAVGDSLYVFNMGGSLRIVRLAVTDIADLIPLA